MMGFEDYEVRIATKEDIPTVNTILEECYHSEEMIFQSLLAKYKSSLSEADLRLIDEDLQTTVAAMVIHHLCQVVIYKPTGKIVGVHIIIASENPKLVPPENRSVDVYKTHPPKSQVVHEYFRYLNDIIDRADLFSKFPEAKHFAESYAIGVDKKHRKSGLAFLMMKEGIDWVCRNRFDVIFGMTSSPYTKKAAEKIGLKCILDFDLLEYKDIHGSSIFEETRGQNVISVVAIPCRYKSKLILWRNSRL